MVLLEDHVCLTLGLLGRIKPTGGFHATPSFFNKPCLCPEIHSLQLKSQSPQPSSASPLSKPPRLDHKLPSASLTLEPVLELNLTQNCGNLHYQVTTRISTSSPNHPPRTAQ
ncbi:hypothetical protein ATANTOWER_020386 [Ataeniobius toweri]|uniref:Uncharacterized protein n=1 Tax=Ataeniobius toweri TaxID=208326 RepID=A0ABU7A9C3_9TELE|nr:hypothetical protein [Ataeniobius toweri]